MHKLTALLLSGVLTLSSGTALAQMDETAGDQDRAAMREMMREMMEEMMREGPPRGGGEERFERAQEATDGDLSTSEEAADRRDGDRRRWRGRHHRMMRAHHGGMGPMAFHGARMKVLFAIFDANGDGAVTIQEMNDMHERIFNAIDQDGDGGVTRAELRDFFWGGRRGNWDR